MAITIEIGINKRQLAEFRRQGQVLPRDLARIGQQAANSVSVDARRRVQQAINETFDHIEPITESAVFARQRRLNGVNATKGITAEIGIRSLQARWIGYHLGEGDNIRLPGVIGPADHEVMIPVWKNLQSKEARAAGIAVRPTRGQNLPAGALRRLFSNMGGQTWNGSQGTNKLFWGKIRPNGAKGLWLRPLRVKDKKTRKVHNAHAPKLLIAARERVKYRPILQEPIKRAVRKASRQFPAKVREGVRRYIRTRPL